MSDYKEMTTKKDIVRCYTEDLITEKEFLTAIAQIDELLSSDQEQSRQQIVADNLVKNVVPMFYGGTPPTTSQIDAIVASFTDTEEWSLSSSNSVRVAMRIANRLAK